MRILFLIFLIGFTFVILAEFSRFRQVIKSISAAEKIEVVIADVLETKIGKTKYLVDPSNNSNDHVEAIGLDFLYIHKIGSKVKAYKTNTDLKIVYWNNTAIAIIYFMGLIIIYIFFISMFLDTPDFKGKLIPVYQSKIFFLIFICFAIGTLFLSNYLYSEGKVFQKASVKTTGTLIDYEEKLCESKDDDGKAYTYKCFSKKYEYLNSIGDTLVHATRFTSSNKDAIGSESDIYYLKSNPSFVKIISPGKMKGRAFALAGFSILFLIGMIYAWNAKMQAYIE